MAEESPVSPVSSATTCVAPFSRSNTGATIRQWDAIPPFERSDQLCKDLEYTHEPEKPTHLRSHRPDQALPDAPRIPLDSCRVVPYCLEDLDTPGMNKLDEKLWWAGPAPYIKTLSQQLTYDRKIVVTENPSLHLLWSDNMIYIKPIPAYLCSFAFWEYILDPSNDGINPEERERVRATSLGFLRTYASLIQRRSDFSIARRYDLLCSFGHTSFEAFVKFIMSFDSVPDKAISPRWRFGEIQLDALNLHSLVHLRRSHFNRFESNYALYFSRFYPAILFLFAVFSVMLSAMQVIVGGRQLKEETDNPGVKRTVGLFEWFSCEAIGWSLAFGAVLFIWWICISSAEAFRRRGIMKRVKKKQREEGALQP
ncbi:hypothetical protein BU26DRAFT_521900 [Trematosphaeria pertusa]|uniref:Uncharacterized protein n=1 Tax=Trematosphaeria pertusa TaxID=390896 RepID=A0A6A6I540_9PLEO|nr:uncharacterized protein BU26DRAFT_521900 [Trematosphaeria pertusa]KAF2245461.1 hypothetical protein BU26DRAFT_521900 [Trematosphaeria pertusa]